MLCFALVIVVVCATTGVILSIRVIGLVSLVMIVFVHDNDIVRNVGIALVLILLWYVFSSCFICCLRSCCYYCSLSVLLNVLLLVIAIALLNLYCYCYRDRDRYRYRYRYRHRFCSCSSSCYCIVLLCCVPLFP